jgi:hypothetical protein
VTGKSCGFAMSGMWSWAQEDYSVTSYHDGQPTVSVSVSLEPGANAVATADRVRKQMEEISHRFNPGLAYRIDYDTSTFVIESLREVAYEGLRQTRQPPLILPARASLHDKAHTRRPVRPDTGSRPPGSTESSTGSPSSPALID